MIIAAMLLTLTALPAAGPTIAVAFQPAVGLTDDEMAQARGRIVKEIEGFGATVDPDAPAVDPACVPDPACVESARVALPSPPTALVVIELLRVGPVVQLTASAAGAGAGASGSQGLDSNQLARGDLLPPDVSAWIAGLVPKQAPPPPPPPPPDEPPLLSPMRTTAMVMGGAGVVAAVGGVVLVAINAPVLDDPNSLGADKEGAATNGLVGFGATIVGLILVGVGVGLFLTAE